MDQDARRCLEDLLDREIELARSLGVTLAAEKIALTGDSPEAVRKAAPKKPQILEALEKLEAERRTLCASPTMSQAREPPSPNAGAP